ncbi:DUF4180 domain-containing protein [Devosia sp. D6-9]|nr:DUF4180 domain-containing protein [Devosia sp. D6-9]
MGTDHINGLKILFYPAEGTLLGSAADALDVIGATYGQEIDVIAIPAARLDPNFFRLRTGLAGEFIQKMQNYWLRLVIVGDISQQVAASDALRDFVYETNKVGRHLFVTDETDLAARLKPL